MDSGPSSAKRIKLYPKSANAPYVVFLRRVECSINVLQIAEFLHSTYKSVVEILKVNDAKLKISFEKRKEANRFIQCPSLRTSYHLYPPSHMVEIDGVVYDQFINPAEIKRNGFGVYKDVNAPAVPVVDVRVLSKCTTDGQNDISKPIRITFSAIILPDYFQIRSVLLPLRFFYPKPMFCAHCKQYGHTARYCFNQICCFKCGKKHSEETCLLKTSTCFRCKTEHALLENCSVLQRKHKEIQLKHKQMRKIMYFSFKDSGSQPSKQKSTPGYEVDDPVESESSQNPDGDKGKMEVPILSPATQPDRLKKDKTVHSSKLKKRTGYKINSNIQSIFSITVLINAICESFVKSPKTKTIIVAMTPFLIHIWKELVIKFPSLECLVSAT